jgi:hypothetical protein
MAAEPPAAGLCPHAGSRSRSSRNDEVFMESLSW